jgi:hypothetical protein
VPPANMDESINDSIIQNSADYKILWPTFTDENKQENMREFAEKAFNAVIRDKI